MTYFLRNFLGVFLLFVFCFPVIAHSKEPATPLVKISLQLKWFHQFQFAGYYAARNLGFYREAGLDVEILEGGPGIKVLDLVTQDRAQFGVLGSELLYHRARGSDVVVLAPIMQHSIRTIIVRSDRGITSPHSLVNKTVMLNKSELPEFAAMFLNEGIDINTLHILNKDKTANAKFIAGEVDAINGSMANQPYLFQQKSTPFHLIKPITYGIDFYGDTLFSTSALLKENPKVVAAFMAASFKGWGYAFDHPYEITDLIYNSYSQKKSKAHLMFEQQQLRGLIHPDLVEIGHNNPERWMKIADTYRNLGLVEEDFRLKGFFYTDYQKTRLAVWMTRLLWILGLGSVLFTLNFLWNFRLRKTVIKITKEIQENEENLRITLNSIGDAVIATDLSGNVMRMNPVAEHLTGWTFKDARGKPLTEIFHIIHTQTREPAENPVEKVLTHGRVVGLANHTALVAKDGTEYQVSDSGAPIKDRQGNTIGVVLVFQDMTDEYQALETIKTNEQKFRSYISNAPHGIFVIDAVGNFLEVNAALCRISGYSDLELSQKTLREILAEPAHDPVDRLVRETMKTGGAHGKASILTRDNQDRVCEFDFAKISGNRILGFVNDISRRMAAETQAANLERFPGENPYPVLRISPLGILLYANRGSKELLRHWDIAIGDPIPVNWKTRVADIFEQNRVGHFEEVYEGKCISLVATPVSEMIYVNIYGMDITSLKKAEQAKEEIIENTPVPMVIVNSSGRIISFNRKFTARYGYTLDDLANNAARWKNIYPDPVYREKINREWQPAAAYSLETGKEVEGILSEIACKDGSSAIVESSIISMDEVSIIVMTDVTEQHKTSQLLRSSESKYRELVEGTNDLITSVDGSGNFLFVNRMSEKFIGPDPESSIGIPAFPFVHPEDQRKTKDWFNACVGEHLPGGMIENRQVNSRTGEIFHMLWTCNFHYDEQGRLKNVNSVARDITQRKRYEDGLKTIALEKPYESGQHFFNTIVTQLARILGADYTLVGELVSSPKRIRTLSLWANGRVEKNIEYALANTPCENVVGDSVCTYKHGVAKLFPEDELLEQMGVEGYVGAPLFDSRKRSIGIVVALFRKPVEDISFAESFLQLVASRTAAEMERSRVEKALRESEKRFRDISMGMADWIWEIDQALHFTYVSQSVEKVLGYLPEEMLGKSPFEFMAEDDSSNALALMTRTAADQAKLKDVEHWYIGKQGNRVCLLENGIPVFDDQENLQGYRGVNKNITLQKSFEVEKKEAERHLQQALKMEAVGTISGGIAHDFNNILGIIIGNVELAMDDIPKWNPIRMNLEEIKTASLRARDVVKQLLSFSRKTEQLKKPMTLQPIIEESIKLLRSSIPTSIEIQVDISRETGTIEADQTQIHQVLINLCTNAAHAMDEDGGILSIQLSEVQLDQLAISQFQEIAPGRYAQLAISDTGHGIDPALKAKIFDPYFTTKEVGKGTGMGLAVVIGIVRSHNGDISVYSEPGKGTTFKVLLPLIDAKETPETCDTHEIPKGEGRIFFIDDEEAIVKMGAMVLGRLGYQVDTETNPLKALERIKADPFGFDLVITDMTMPHLTGDRLAREIIKSNPQLPIIICSGFSNKMNRDLAREIGIARYIDKPLNKSEMAKAINEVLSGGKELHNAEAR